MKLIAPFAVTVLGLGACTTLAAPLAATEDDKTSSPPSDQPAADWWINTPGFQGGGWSPHWHHGPISTGKLEGRGDDEAGKTGGQQQGNDWYHGAPVGWASPAWGWSWGWGDRLKARMEPREVDPALAYEPHSHTHSHDHWGSGQGEWGWGQEGGWDYPGGGWGGGNPPGGEGGGNHQGGWGGSAGWGGSGGSGNPGGWGHQGGGGRGGSEGRPGGEGRAGYGSGPGSRPPVVHSQIESRGVLGGAFEEKSEGAIGENDILAA